jgi:hypothetical protein
MVRMGDTPGASPYYPDVDPKYINMDALVPSGIAGKGIINDHDCDLKDPLKISRDLARS